ncbi:hypothetical protein BAE44_0010249, partial [Dichanthelium oligosanthes]
LCSPCAQEPETAEHLCLHFPFANEVWKRIRTWTGELVQVPEPGIAVDRWWMSALTALPKQARRLKASILIYTVWTLWKERNRRTFEGKSARPQQVVVFIEEETALRKLVVIR